MIKTILLKDNEPDKVTVEGQGDMTLPLKKKRALPDWMEKVAESPTKSKSPAKKQKPMPASKKAGKDFFYIQIAILKETISKAKNISILLYLW